MTRRSVWLVVVLLLVATVGFLLAFAQQDGGSDVTLEQLYHLLVTEDGRSRLDILEERVGQIGEEVDLIHSVAVKMLEEQYGFFEQEEWTLDDLKFQMNAVETMLQDVKDCLSCP